MVFSRAGVLGMLFGVAFVVAFVAGLLHEAPTESCAFERPREAVTVVDVAYGVEPSQLSALVRLEHDERVIAVDDRAVPNDLAAGAAIAERGLGSGKFLDLTVGSARGTRRVLVLMH